MFLLFCVLTAAFAPAPNAQEVLCGEVIVELEPVYGLIVDEKYPLDKDEACRRALEEAAYLFSAQIYGWSFHYDIGERARGIAEEYKLIPQGSLPWGDPALKVREARFNEDRLEVWIDYRPKEAQLKRLLAWKQGRARTAQALGYCPLGVIPPSEESSLWLAIRKAALEDAARAAVREMLRGSERNRPKEAAGFISLQAFPRFFMSSGRWVCSARFLAGISEIIPFAAY